MHHTQFIHAILTQQALHPSLPASLQEEAWVLLQRWFFADDPDLEADLASSTSMRSKEVLINDKLQHLFSNTEFNDELRHLMNQVNSLPENKSDKLNEEQVPAIDAESVADSTPTAEKDIVDAKKIEIRDTKNVVVDNNITAGGNIHLGDVYLNPATKELELKCPNCGKVADKEYIDTADSTLETIQDNFSEIICSNCGFRFFEIANLADNVALVKGLTPVQADDFKALARVVDNTLRRRDAKRAYERCEVAMEKFGNSAPIYEYCALTYFFATPIHEIVNSSARDILEFLKDSRQIDINSPTRDPIAGLIAFRYARAIGFSLEILRVKQAKPLAIPANTGRKEKQGIREQYRKYLIRPRRDMLSYVRQYKKCYDIFPYSGFHQQIVQEIAGYNETTWLNIRLVSIFLKPKGVKTPKKGFVWDYYEVENNLPEFNEDTGGSPLQLLLKVFELQRAETHGYKLPKIRVGDWSSNQSMPINKKLARNALLFWIAVLLITFLSVLIGGYAWIVLVIGAGLVATRFDKVRDSISDTYKALKT